MSDHDFTGRHVVLTGASGALGRAVLDRLTGGGNGKGATVHAPMIETVVPAPLRGAPGLVATTGVDLADDAAVAAYYAALPPLWASIHVAGGFAMQPIADMDRAALSAMLDMNLVSALLCCRGAVGAIRRGLAAGQPGGRIVNVAALPALEPRQGAGKIAYTASKAGLAGATLALAQEVAAEGIWVNAIAPSTMDTPANRAAMPGADYASWAKVEDVAEVIAFLASPQNRVARGAIVPVYGRG